MWAAHTFAPVLSHATKRYSIQSLKILDFTRQDSNGSVRSDTNNEARPMPSRLGLQRMWHG
jgi:hypothetical protein